MTKKLNRANRRILKLEKAKNENNSKTINMFSDSISSSTLWNRKKRGLGQFLSTAAKRRSDLRNEILTKEKKKSKMNLWKEIGHSYLIDGKSEHRITREHLGKVQGSYSMLRIV